MALIYKVHNPLSFDPLCPSTMRLTNAWKMYPDDPNSSPVVPVGCCDCTPGSLGRCMYCYPCLTPTVPNNSNCFGSPCRLTAYDITIAGVVIGIGGTHNAPDAANGTWRLYSNAVKPLAGYENLCVWSSSIFEIDFCVGTAGICFPYLGCNISLPHLEQVYWIGYPNSPTGRFSFSLLLADNSSACLNYELQAYMESLVGTGTASPFSAYCPKEGTYNYVNPIGVGIIQAPNGYDPTNATFTLAAVVDP